MPHGVRGRQARGVNSVCLAELCALALFVRQPEKWRNSGYWLITDWGWKALRGEPVPKRAKYFRGKLIERSTEVTTLSEMFQTHKHEVERAIARGRAVKADYRADVATYNPIEWTGFGGYEAGKLFS